MANIDLGLRTDGSRLVLTPEARAATHTHVIGGSGKGKSKFLERLIRSDIDSGQGLCIIDWHGELYHNVLKWCHWRDVGLFNDYRKLVLVNPSVPEYISSFNPFLSRDGEDESSRSSRAEKLIAVMLRAWGGTSANEMPTFERMCRALFHFVLEARETLPNAARLLDFDQSLLREYAIRMITDSSAQATWRELQHVKRFEDWKGETLSTKNRLTRFVGSTGVRRFMGLNRSEIDVPRMIAEQQIVIINLGESKHLRREPAKLFAALLLREFFDAAMESVNRELRYGVRPKPFVLYLDEFQEYINDDMAAMLDAVRKGGLHFVMAHQHLGHFLDNPKLQNSIFTNARIRAVFGGLSYPDASAIVNEMCLEELNTRQIKQAYYSHYTVSEEEIRIVRSEGVSEGENWAKHQATGTSSTIANASTSGSGQTISSGEGAPGDDPLAEVWLTQMSGSNTFSAESSSASESESKMKGESEGGSKSKSSTESVVPFLKPIHKTQLSSETEWSREEKVSKLAESLKYQAERHCFVRLDTAQAEPILVPQVFIPHIYPETLLEYERTIFRQQGSLPAAEIDSLLVASEREFMARALTPVAPLGASVWRDPHSHDDDFDSSV